MSELKGRLVTRDTLLGTLSLGVEYYKGDTGESGVYMGESEPTNPDVSVWIEPAGEASENGLVTQEELDKALANVEVDLTGYATEENVTNQINDATAQTIEAVEEMGYQTADDVETAITEKGYQTSEQVDEAINTALNKIGVAEEGSY